MARLPAGEIRKQARPRKRPPAPEVSTIVQEVSAPTEDTIREVLARIEEAFNALGTDQMPGTIIPAGSKNNSREAAEFVVADRLSKLAETRKKQASEAAEKAGVFGTTDNYIVGDTVMVWNDPNFSINVKLGRPSKMIGREETQAVLLSNFGVKKAAELLEECMKDRSATKQIIVSMK